MNNKIEKTKLGKAFEEFMNKPAIKGIPGVDEKKARELAKAFQISKK